MSSIVIQVGQCGNQIGQHFWKQVIADDSFPDSYVWKNGDGKLRSVHIDSEPKVVNGLKRHFKSDVLREENLKTGRRGRGSNWALGYHGTRHSSEDVILAETMEVVRREVERCPNFCGFILMHSLSGGTGSGLGSHLTELLREEYPLAHIMNCVVTSYRSGESCLQHYNTLLSLAWLHRYSDCVVVFDNDEILSRVEKQRRGDSAEKPVSFTNINRHIGACLAGLFLPTDSLKASCGFSIGLEPWEMVRSICPMPPLKYLHVHHQSKSKVSWEHLAGGMLQTLPKQHQNGTVYHSLGNLVVARGDSTNTFSQSRARIESRVKTAYHTVPWNPFPVDFWTSSTNSLGGKDRASITVAANYSNVSSYCDDVIQGAWRKYQAGAYLHWYEQYGCPKATFEEAFDTMDSLVKEYKDAVT